jgi:general secretion pathway protein J
MTVRKITGFTLVELLVAITVLGILGIISWRGLDHVIDQRARISEQDAQVERLIRTIAQLERDFDECIADSLLVSRTTDSTTLPSCLNISQDRQSRPIIIITRRHPSGKGSSTVRYQLEGESLVRLTTSVDRSQTDRVLMLNNVVTFDTRFLSRRGWIDTPDETDTRVMAIEIAIERLAAGRYVKVIPL